MVNLSSRAWGYGYALLTVAIALLLTLLLDPWLEMTRAPFLLFFTAVIVSAWYGGLLPGIIATLLAAIASSSLLSSIPSTPHIHLLSASPAEAMRLALFIGNGLLVNFLCESLRRAYRQVESSLQMNVARQQAEDLAYQLSEQLRDQANTLNAILNTSVDHIYVIGQDDRYCYVSQGGAAVLGFRPADMIGKTWQDLELSPEIMTKVDAHRMAVLTSGQPQRAESSLATPAGTIQHFEYILTPLRNPGGRVEAVIAISRDVTQRKQSEQAIAASEAHLRAQHQELERIVAERQRTENDLRRANERFELATSAVKCLVYDWDAVTAQLERTQGLKDILGYTPEEAEPTQQWWNDRIHPEDLPRVHADIIQALADVETDHFTAEYRIRHRNGQYRHLWDRATIKRDLQGQVVRVIGCSLDVTERKRVEIAQRYLAESSSLLFSSLDYQRTLSSLARLMVPHLADWCTIHIVAADGSVQQLATAHIDPDKIKWAHEINEKYPFDLEAPHGAPNVLRTGKSELYSDIPDAMLVEVAKDTEHLQILREVGFRSAMVVPLRLYDRILGVLTFISTESDRLYGQQDLAVAEELAHRAALAVENARLYRSAQDDRAQAEAANRAKDEFLATLSHELRTPLNAMLGWTQILINRQLDPATTQRALQTIHRNTKSLTTIIEDLLDVSRIITGKLRLEMQPVELVPVLSSAMEAVQVAAEAKGIELRLITNPELEAPGVTPVLGDADRLRQVIWNLLTNAIKFTPAGGQVSVECDRTEHGLEIRVRDTGMGISPEFLPYVFDRFRQADSSTTRHHGGLGLGLSIVRHLVELQGGTVAVDSPGLGQGSLFTVRLPLRVAPPMTGQGFPARSHETQ